VDAWGEEEVEREEKEESVKVNKEGGLRWKAGTGAAPM